MNKLIKFYRFLLPFESLTIASNLSFSEVWQKLDKIIEPPKTLKMALQFKKSHKPYEGTLSGNTFQIRRIISSYRNSFLPQITGEIHSQPFGCSLKIRMNLHLAVMVFMIVWMSVPASMGLLTLLVWLVDRSIGLIFLPLFGMCIFGWSLSLIGFKIESKKDIKFFSNMFGS
ncbi:hypothetical protein IQ270_18355 [Microcoleus sp. LEGE 07076]|uniref:hypothetical protein n=1 Tax=Microcoleus sp. LEGE 07076 TaxID=915322 RepID=UPI001881D7CB|nr:hypothetical protein [Microcoleus sp. LEGE 07076]MBE9186595.1 hypothetical protein [Microcoleus sp. LEGE 07076]